MRKLPAALSALVIAAALTQGLASLASSPFSGSLRAQIGLDVPAGGVTIQTTSNVTFVDLSMAYKIGDVTFSSLMSFDATGIAVLQFRGRGVLDPVEFDSRLTFSPILGGAGSTLDLNESWINPSHLYDFGRIYFVGQIEVTSLTLEDNANTRWRVRVSKDGTAGSWVWVSDEITGNTSVPVVFPIGRYVQYAEIVGITGYISDSAISVQIASEAFVTDVDVDAFGVSLEVEFAYATGESDFSISLGPSEKGGVFDSATLSFGIDSVTCFTCFETLEIELDLPFACLDEGSVDIGFDLDDGFSGLTLDTRGIPTGLSWLSLDLDVEFSTAEKDVDLWPSLELERFACVTPYFKIDLGSEVWEIEGLTLYGLRLRYDVNGVTVESLSYLDDIHHTKEDYWERFRVSVDGDSCCGGRFDFETSTHFGRDDTTLFDWAETELELDIDVGYNVTFGGYVAFVPSGLSDLIFRFRVTW